jgi:TolB-like protein
MGAVYRATDPKLRRDVAIKTLPQEFAGDPERLSRFRHEARVLASLNHPNIAAIYGLEESDGVNFLVLELVEGDTLAELLKQTGAIPVLDFGLVKVLPNTSTQTASVGVNTETGRILGTPRYMSPEQARGQEVDHGTDTWAFGCVLYELLTGRHAMDGKTVSDVIACILQGQPDSSALPTSTPVQVRHLLQRCLAKSRSERLQEISHAKQDLEEALERPRRQLFARRRLVISAATTAAAAVAVALNAGGLRDRWFTSGLGIKSIAVLPLANLSGSPDQEYFSGGMTESLITDLAKIGALKVISRTSIMAYKGTKKPLREIAQELNVDAILEGSALRSGNRIRITSQLINAKTDRHIWAESYDRDFADVILLPKRSGADGRAAGPGATDAARTNAAEQGAQG